MKKLHYLGPEGSFSHLLAKQLNQRLQASYELCANESFSKIASAVLADVNSVGLLVVENSITSDVHEAVDLLFTANFRIVAEAQLKIRMNLVGLEQANLSNIRTVASKLPAIAQCSKFIETNNFNTQLMESTAAALQKIIKEQDLTTAAIGAAALTEQYQGTKILAVDVANQKNNLTRFVLVENFENLVDPTVAAQKLTIMVELPHKTGSLAQYLQLLAEVGANLTRIESRPVPGTDWEYQFWIDLECDPSKMTSILAAVEAKASHFKLIGTYNKGEVFES